MRMPLCGIARATKYINTAYLLIKTEVRVFFFDLVHFLFYAAVGKCPGSGITHIEARHVGSYTGASGAD